ncbi:hypothetical protein [Nonlabens sp.]|uniref:hypothetical protein n=1 Tax=Nonlabens sp. TaxID=1888209 RepID=UPI003F69D1B5
MTQNELIGTYVIEGSNQDASKSSYKGTLQLSLDHHQRILAQWTIAEDQTQQGIGFFKNNILVINFQYHNEVNQLFKGTVVYNCLTPELLEGFWSEEKGDPQFLGTEMAYRVSNENTVLH